MQYQTHTIEQPVRLPHPQPLPLPLDVPVDTPTGDEQETCYVCGSRDLLTECESCEQLICDAHTRIIGRACFSYSEWCPVCYRKKQRGEL